MKFELLVQKIATQNHTKLALIAFLNVIAGLAQTFLLYVINSSVGDYHQHVSSPLLSFLLFAFSSLLFLALTYMSARASSLFVHDILINERKEVISIVENSSISGLENIGINHLIDALTNGLSNLGRGITIIIGLVPGLTLAVCGVIYLLFIAQSIAWLLILFIVLFIWTLHKCSYQLVKNVEYFNYCNKKTKELASNCLKGIKELRLNKSKRTDIYDSLVDFAIKEHNSRYDCGMISLQNSLYLEVSFFILVGMLVYITPIFISADDLSNDLFSQVTVVMYMLPVISGLSNGLSGLYYAVNSLEDIDELKSNLEKNSESSSLSSRVIREDKINIALHNVEYKYLDNGNGNGNGNGNNFHVGPLNLNISWGETLFIVGGNGSGKTTFMKVLSGLYLPHSGHITFNKTIVDNSNLVTYRQHFSAIFSDFYFFDRAYGINPQDYQKIIAVLSKYKVADKVKFIDGKYQFKKLSGGERKRVGLGSIQADSSKVLLLDEWAKDQDPAFRRHFYYELLPLLKKKWPTIIAITHDDRYFHTADRILKMDWGQIVTIDYGKNHTKE